MSSVDGVMWVSHCCKLMQFFSRLESFLSSNNDVNFILGQRLVLGFGWRSSEAHRSGKFDCFEYTTDPYHSCLGRWTWQWKVRKRTHKICKRKTIFFGWKIGNTFARWKFPANEISFFPLFCLFFNALRERWVANVFDGVKQILFEDGFMRI